MIKNKMAEIKPETREEQRILESEEFNEALHYGTIRPGHPEGNLENHIQDIMGYIDSHPIPSSRERLRTIAFLHDLGKVPLWKQYGTTRGKSHSELSREIARTFTQDEDVLETIAHHDKYFSFFVKSEKNRKFNSPKFIETFSPLNLNLLTQFMYCDTNTRRSTDSIEWFKEKCLELNLASQSPLVFETSRGEKLSLDSTKQMTAQEVYESTIDAMYGLIGISAAREYIPDLVRRLKLRGETIRMFNISPDMQGTDFLKKYNTLTQALEELASKTNISDNEISTKTIKTVTDYLTPLCDYSDAADPRCPDSQKSNGATRDSWLDAISPRRRILNLSHSTNITLGRMQVPSEIIREE